MIRADLENALEGGAKPLIDPTQDAGLAAFPISLEEFSTFADFFYRKTGVQFAENKRYFVDRRIADRARVVACETFREYFALLRGLGANSELQELTNLLTVNETYFFRENYQFDSLVQSVLPGIAARKKHGGTIRIWSLPCSTGEEAYSIAIAVLEGWAQSDQFQVEILASDIDTRVLADAKAGIFSERSLQHVGTELRARYFQQRARDAFHIIPELRGSIDFFQLNLSDSAAMARIRNVDVIFCRNLLIYFDDAARNRAVASMFESLVDGGFLYLGHSESLNRIPSRFTAQRLGECIVYQRPPEGR